jgi:hypothetical protein
MASNNDNNKRKIEEEAESSTAARKRLRLSDDGGRDDSSSESEEEMETEEEDVSSEESSMNQLDTSEEKSMAKRDCGLFFSDDGNTSSTEPESRSLRTPSSRVRSDPDDYNDFYCQVARATCPHNSNKL